MARETLEGEAPQVEGAERTSVMEAEKPTEPKEKPTVRTYTEEEYRREVDRALGKGLESTNRQLSLAKTEAERAKAELGVQKAMQAKLDEEVQRLTKDMDRLAEERFADDPDALKGYRQTKDIELRAARAKLREEELNKKESELEGLRWAITMHTIADEIQKEYKVPRKVLESCTSEEQMRSIADSFPKVEEPEADTKPAPKFDTGLPSGSGSRIYTNESISELRDKIAKSNNLKEMQDAMAELDKAMREGRVKQ